MTLKFEQLTVGSYGTNCYLLTCPDTNEALLIDPGADAEAILALCEGAQVTRILLTHGHYDHVAALKPVRDQLNVPVGISASETIVPKKTDLYQNYPNPFNPATTIAFDLNKKQTAVLKIYNSLGQKVRSFSFDQLSAGQHKISWDGKNSSGNAVSSGLYYYLLKADGFRKVRKMLLIR